MFGFTDYRVSFLASFSSELTAEKIYLFRNLVGLLVQKNSPIVFLYLHRKIHKDLENLDMRLCHGKVSNTRSQFSSGERHCASSMGQLLCSELPRSILVPFHFRGRPLNIISYHLFNLAHLPQVLHIQEMESLHVVTKCCRHEDNWQISWTICLLEQYPVMGSS